MYDNSSFTGDAHECFLAVKAAFGNLEHPHIFFLNTKQDINVLLNDAGIPVLQRNLLKPEKFYEILPNEREKRFKLLRNVPIVVNDLHGGGTTDDLFGNFDVCSVVAPRNQLSKCVTQMTDSSISRIIQFAVANDLEESYHVTDSILNLIDNFFQFSLTTSHRNLVQWKKIRDDAQKWGEAFFERFQQQVNELLGTIHTNILRHLLEHSVNISERATKFDRCNDPLESKSQQITKQSVKGFIKIAIQEEVIKVAVNEIINQTKDTFQQKITHELNINIDNNELLLAAQRQVLIDISVAKFDQRTWSESILSNITMVPMAISRLVKGIRTLMDVEYWNKTKLDDFATKDEYDAYNDALDFSENLMNPQKRKDFANTCLEKMKTNIQKRNKSFERNLKEWIEDRKICFFQNIESNYKIAIQNLSSRKLAYQITSSYFGQFARIQCQLLAVKHLQNFNGQLPTIDTTIKLGQGAFFAIYSAQWGDKKDLVVKKAKCFLPDYPYLQYLEAHYHRKITLLAIPHIVPLLYLFDNLSNEHDLWVFLPRYKQSLKEYLEKNIQTITHDRIIKIALDIGNVIVKLHSNEIVHRDIKSKNILLDDNDECYLADFGTCKQTTFNETIVGTYPLPPEMILSIQHDPTVNYDGMAVDIYSFGILLYELLPKSQYYRPHSNEADLNINELLTKVLVCDINNDDYQLLIKSCLSQRAQERPTAREVIEKLEQIKKSIEQKFCVICETNARKCRYYPCGHKLLCEYCYNRILTNAEGKRRCDLCRRIVDRWQEDDENQTFYINA